MQDAETDTTAEDAITVKDIDNFNMRPYDMLTKYRPAGLRKCESGSGQANVFVNKLQAESCLSCGIIYDLARRKEIALIKTSRANQKVKYDPFVPMEGSSTKYKYDYFVAMKLCPYSGFNSNDYVKQKDYYANAHIIIIIVVAIIVTIVCCGWYFCCRVTEVKMDYADRDIRERQLRGSSSKYLESNNVRREIIPVFSNHVSNAEAPVSQRKLVTNVETARSNVNMNGNYQGNVGANYQGNVGGNYNANVNM